MFKDVDWRELLKHARAVECYTGCPYPQETEEEVASLKHRFAKLMMDEADMSRVEEIGWSPGH